VPLSGHADADYTRINEIYPERVAAQPGPDAINADCIHTGIKPLPDKLRGLGEILASRSVDLIVTEVFFWGAFPLLLGPRDARPPILTIGVLPLFVNSCDVGVFSG